MDCTRVAIAGVSSEVGKTTLLCDLLQAFPGWEAIKMTRGHYRSCGKDPHACCVSHLLGDEPLIRSGFQQTYASDKDTGRYWDAGAANVHWAVVTDDQVESGINQSLERVNAPGVLIEGNSFLRYIDVDFTVLVASNAPEGVKAKMKGSTRWAFRKAAAIYVSDYANFRSELSNSRGRGSEFKSGLSNLPSANQIGAALNSRFALPNEKHEVPVYGPADLPKLVAQIKSINTPRFPDSPNAARFRPSQDQRSQGEKR